MEKIVISSQNVDSKNVNLQTEIKADTSREELYYGILTLINSLITNQDFGMNLNETSLIEKFFEETKNVYIKEFYNEKMEDK